MRSSRLRPIAMRRQTSATWFRMIRPTPNMPLYNRAQQPSQAPRRPWPKSRRADCSAPRNSMNASEHLSARYRIQIAGHLDPAWSIWFDDLAIVQEDDGTTTLTGQVVDQAALYGLLARLRDLGALLLAVERLEPDRH